MIQASSIMADNQMQGLTASFQISDEDWDDLKAFLDGVTVDTSDPQVCGGLDMPFDHDTFARPVDAEQRLQEGAFNMGGMDELLPPQPALDMQHDALQLHAVAGTPALCSMVGAQLDLAHLSPT